MPTQRKNMTKLLSEREEFLVIGLTGRVGSGCSEAAAIFCSDYPSLNFSEIHPGDRGFSDDEQRDKRVLHHYAREHWVPFDLIQVRNVIATFLLDRMDSFANELVELLKPVAPKWMSEDDPAQAVLDRLHRKTMHLLDGRARDNVFTDTEKDELLAYCSKALPGEQLSIPQKVLKSPAAKYTHRNLSGFFKLLYNTILPDIDYENRVHFLRLADRFLFYCAGNAAKVWLADEANPSDPWSSLNSLNVTLSRKKGSFHFKQYFFVRNIMPALGEAVHQVMLEAGQPGYTAVFQKYGNSLRRFGEIVFELNPDDSRFGSFQQDIFSIPRKINQFIKVLRHPFSNEYARPTRIVIDSLKNPFEAMYLRDRYSAFYLFAISANEEVRNARLGHPPKRMNLQQIHFADWNEYPSQGKMICDKFGTNADDSSDEAAFARQVAATEKRDVFTDLVRSDAYQKNLHLFVLQDVGSSIENADIFISNTSSDGPGSQNRKLAWDIVRNVCLILYPGLLLPTPVERCMQIAFTAKANSGCLSRQVGAVVTDPQYNILSIGWNDVPCGDISCARKNLIDLAKGWDSAGYTRYEKHNPDFRKRLQCYNVDSPELKSLLCGLPMRYCFKDLHLNPGEKNPMRSRSMHAEEKALALCGAACVNGCLFTTSSPCEMCSKNAKNHRIKKIYYIEPYPGISEDQYTKSGDEDNIAEHILFDGAIGRAYTQMYTPIMPHKDILKLLGVPDRICE